MKDRAWPFPHGKPPNGGGSEQCTKMLGRTTACGGAWGEQERRMAGVLVGVAVTVFVIKVRGSSGAVEGEILPVEDGHL